jgi:hypothetical protein
LPIAAVDDCFRWFRPRIANRHSRRIMMACAKIGNLSAFGAAGEHPVTEVFYLRRPGPRPNP